MERASATYAFTRNATWERFAANLGGQVQALMLVLADAELDPAAHDALEKSAAALGWEGAVAYLNCRTPKPLSKAELYEAVEGLDPVAVVIAGHTARTLVEQAYACTVEPEGRFRLFGRTACCFSDLSSLMGSEEGKQKAWSLLKGLSRSL